MIYLGLGSNLLNPVEQLKQAIKKLKNHPDIILNKVSSFYLKLLFL